MAKAKCEGCRDGRTFTRPFSMAFQPIVDVEQGGVYAYEALVRGPQGEGALSVLSAVDTTNRYAFDQQCRVTAIEHAARLGLAQQDALLSINFLPNAVYEPSACIKLTLATAQRTGFPISNLMFEFTEGEQVDHAHLGNILKTYKALGFKTAIDDFGAGYSGLNLLAKLQPDVVKLDMDLIRDIDTDRVKRALVGGVARICREIGVEVLAEGIETMGEYETLCDIGVRLLQGFLFAKPGFETLPTPQWPAAKFWNRAAVA